MGLGQSSGNRASAVKSDSGLGHPEYFMVSAERHTLNPLNPLNPTSQGLNLNTVAIQDFRAILTKDPHA